MSTFSFSSPSFDALGSVWSIVAWSGLIIAAIYLAVTAIRCSCRHLSTWSRLPARLRLLVLLFISIIPVAFWYTWTYMLRLLWEDIDRSGLSHDLYAYWFSHAPHRKHSLFFEAYARVTDTAGAWLISGRVLGFVLTWSIWMYVEGARYHLIRYVWALIWLGFLAAISVALPIWMVTLLVVQYTQKPDPSRSPLTPFLLICTLIALSTMFIIPTSTAHTYLPLFHTALVIGHAIVLIPFMIGTQHMPSTIYEIRKTSSYIVATYAFLAAACLFIYIDTVMKYLTPHISLLKWLQSSASWSTLFSPSSWLWLISSLYTTSFPISNHAQMSISCDWVFIQCECLLFYIADTIMNYHGRERTHVPLLLMILTPIIPIDVLFPLYLIHREVQHPIHPMRATASKKAQ